MGPPVRYNNFADPATTIFMSLCLLPLRSTKSSLSSLYTGQQLQLAPHTLSAPQSLELEFAVLHSGDNYSPISNDWQLVAKFRRAGTTKT